PDVLLLEDDHLGPIAGVPLHTLAAAGGRWAATRSVSKVLGPDLRVAVLAGDDTTVARVRGHQLCGPGRVSHVLQRLAAPPLPARTAGAERTHGQRRRALSDALGRRGLDASGASGLNVWLAVSDEAATVAALLARGWAVAGGGRYKLRDRGGAIRVTTAS